MQHDFESIELLPTPTSARSTFSRPPSPIIKSDAGPSSHDLALLQAPKSPLSAEWQRGNEKHNSENMGNLYTTSAEASTSGSYMPRHARSDDGSDVTVQAETDAAGETLIPVLDETQLYPSALEESRTQATLARWAHQDQQRRARERERELELEASTEYEPASAWTFQRIFSIFGRYETRPIPLNNNQSPLTTYSTQGEPRRVSGGKGRADSAAQYSGLNINQLRFDAEGQPISVFERRVSRPVSPRVETSKRAISHTEIDIAKVHSDAHMDRIHMEEGRLTSNSISRQSSSSQDDESEIEPWLFDRWFGLGRARTKDEAKQGGWTNPME